MAQSGRFANKICRIFDLFPTRSGKSWSRHSWNLPCSSIRKSRAIRHMFPFRQWVLETFGWGKNFLLLELNLNKLKLDLVWHMEYDICLWICSIKFWSSLGIEFYLFEIARWTKCINYMGHFNVSKCTLLQCDKKVLGSLSNNYLNMLSK